MDQLSYDDPEEILEPGLTPQQTLEHRVREAVRERWPPIRSPGGREPRGHGSDGQTSSVPDRVAAQIARELRLIAELGYAPYFLLIRLRSS